MNSGTIAFFRGSKATSLIEHAHNGPVSALAVVRDGAGSGDFVLSGGQDGMLRLWKGKECQKEIKIDEALHNKHDERSPPTGYPRAITLVNWPLVAVGTSRNLIILIVFPVENELSGRVVIHSHSDILQGLAVHPFDQSFVTAGEDKSLRLWTTREQIPHRAHVQVASTLLPKPARSVAFSANGELLAAGLLNGQLLLLEVPSLRIIKSFKYRAEPLSDIKFSPDNTVLAVTSHDNFIDIYRVGANNSWSHSAKLRGHSSYVRHCDFSTDGMYLQTTCGANELLYWDVEAQCQNKSGSSELRDCVWNTWTIPFGWPVIGIWEAGTDGTDINSVCMSNRHKEIATGGDDGLVKLFSSPASKYQSKFVGYRGHSSHVMNVRFSRNDKYLISVGGFDQAIFVWRHVF